ncbi:MAG: hypothetical protein ACOZAJ_01920, partial [Patescibacteria group bacterium]
IEKAQTIQENLVVYQIKGGDYLFISNSKKKFSFFVDLICFRPVIIFLPYLDNQETLQSFFKIKNSFPSKHIFYLNLIEWFGGRLAS